MGDPGEFLNDEEKLNVVYGDILSAVKSVRVRHAMGLRMAYQLVQAWERTPEAESLGVVPRMGVAVSGDVG